MTIFRKILLFFLFFFSFITNAQVANYGFSQLTGTYTGVTGNVLGSTTSDEQRFVDPAVPAGSTTSLTGVGLPIGFNFTYNGVVYDRFGVNNNGWISLGQSALGALAVDMNASSSNNPISTTSTASANLQARISALGRDLQGQTGSSLTYTTLGATPNKTLVVQWNKYRRFSGTGENFSFQIKLHETTNAIDIVFGAFTTTSGTANTAQLGLRGFTNTDYNNRQVTSGINTWATSTNGSANNSSVAFLNTLLPVSGQTFRWVPSVACSGTPNAGTTITSKTLICTTTTVALSLAGATNGVSGLTYQWYESSDASNWIALTTATNIATTQLVDTTTYFKCMLTCGSSTATSAPAQVSLTTYSNAVPYFEGFEGITTANELPNCSWSRTNNLKCQTNLASASDNRIPRSGSKFANFTWDTNPLGDYFFTNGIQLNAGVNYYASAYYITDGSDGWSDFSLQYGATPTPSAMTNIISATGTLTNTTYLNLAGTFSVSSSGLYHIGVKAIGDTLPFYLSFDDLSIVEIPNCTLTPVAGPIAGSSNVYTGTTNSYSLSSSVGNIQWYKSTAANGPWLSIPNATTSVLSITSNSPGNVFLTAIASNAGCANDTVNVPFQITATVLGNDVCNAIPLSIGTSTRVFSVYGATTQTGEVTPPATGATTNDGWENSNLDNSIWFSFVAPASGNISIQSPGFDSQLALWKASSCGALLSATTATLLAANDDDASYASHGGSEYSSFINASCLTSGATYYIQLDSYNPALVTDTTRIKIADLGGLNKSFTGLSASYCFAGAPTTFTPATAGGLFTIDSNTSTVTAFSPSVAGVGTHTVTYSLFGCKTTSTTIVKATPTLTVNGTSSPICKGASATFTASGATTYAWAPTGGSAATAVVTPTTSTNYTVTGTTNGCSAKVVKSVTVIATPSITVNSATICNGNSATLTASGATTYSWNTSATTESIIVTPTTSTNYTVTGTSSGCSSTKIASVSVNSIPFVNAGANATLTCGSPTATLAGSGSVSTYTWSGAGIVSGANSATATIGSAGVYTLVGSSSAGCVSGASTVNVSSSSGVPTLTITPSTTICLGSSTILTVSTAAGNSILWSNSASTTTIAVTPTATTNYSVVVTNTTSSCKTTGNVLVTVNTPPTANAGSSQTITCNNPTLTLNGSGVTTYTWTGTGIVSGANTANPVVNKAGTFILRGTTGACLSNTVSVTIASNTVAPSLTITPSASICINNSTTLTATSNPTTVSYAWSPIGLSTKTVAVSPTVTTTYSALVTNTINGCSTSKSTTVTVNNMPTVTASSATVCAGSSTILTASGAATYTWMPGGLTGTTVTVNPSSNITYTVLGRSTPGCTNTASSNVVVSNGPTVTVTNEVICSGSTATVTANGATSYSWNTGSNSSSITVSPNATSVYTVAGYIGSCSQTKTVSVTVNQTPTLAITNVTNGSCFGACDGGFDGMITGGSGPYVFDSSFGLAGLPALGVCADTYTINATDDLGCTSLTRTVTILEPTPLIATISYTNSTCGACADGKATVTIGGGSPNYTVTWSNGANGFTNNNLLPGCYTVTVFDANGCSLDSTICVGFGTGIKAITASNYIALYPNPTDGFITVEVDGLQASSNFEVYDALGKMVAKEALLKERNALDLTKLQDGVYMYKIINGTTTLKTGRLVKH